MKIEVGKTYLNRAGDPVRVLCVDASADMPIIGLSDNGCPDTYGTAGNYFEDAVESQNDLVSEYVEPPKPREVWFHMGNIGPGGLYSEMDRDYLLANNPDGAAKLVKFREVIEA